MFSPYQDITATRSKHTFLLLIVITILLWPNISQATNGYFQHGIGIKEQSLGGAAIAYPQSTMSAASNPATLPQNSNRLDLGVDWFQPSRSASKGYANAWHNSDSEDFLIPQFGVSYRYSDALSLGLVAYANGGMQTDWQENFFGTTPTYSDLKQFIVAPTLTYHLTDSHAVGFSLNYIRQSFEARGLQDFRVFTPSNSSDYLTDQGEDTTSGWGVRIGYFGQLADWLNVGAFWQPQTSMDKFSSYRELLPEQGGMDVPASYGVGVALKLHPKVMLAADWTSIRYADVATLGNRNNIGMALLGSDNGPGFGWRNVNIIKLGINYRPTADWALRLGWSHGTNPVRSSETTMNILSPATITDHFTCGLSWQPTQASEISLTYWRGYGEKVKGNYAADNGADDASLKMRQENLGLAYSWIF